ncbi:hypothetical protein [Adhaeribacter aquaticus]|uniref:hypothetical protein n=1 Tax=Adhaeribacter aquaticus TaxID=299567 RepID=UPI00047D8808|nr:hypothetical protein [Adhaeribacter aquaticus]
MKKVLRKLDGGEFITIEYKSHEGWVYVNWIGLQSVETVKAGGEAMLEALKETGCSKFLNDNRELVGPWDKANDWVQTNWTPRMLEAGLKYLAFIVSHGRYGKLSAEDAHRRIGNKFEMKLFDSYDKATTWLQSVN